MSGPSIRLKLRVGRSLSLPDGSQVDREGFYSWLWGRLADEGLQGVHEGTLLSEQAHAAGVSTESWTLDSAEAPRERDWVSGQEVETAELFFDGARSAEKAARVLSSVPGIQIGEMEAVPDQDWDAEWKASFLANPDGVVIPPFWRILPPFVTPGQAALAGGERILKINPGAGFGTGTHETTQLCLEAIGRIAPSLQGWRCLDFGSGSGILAIGAAVLGASVDAVEIDPLAIDNARENAALNGVSGRLRFSERLSDEDPRLPRYRLVIANILRPVLIQFARELVSRLEPGGHLILSGLIEADVQEVSKVYSAALGRTPKVSGLGEWRALKWG